MMTEALLPSVVSANTSGAILFAGADTVRGCAEALPSASRTIMIPAKQSTTPIRTRNVKKPFLEAVLVFIVFNHGCQRVIRYIVGTLHRGLQFNDLTRRSRSFVEWNTVLAESATACQHYFESFSPEISTPRQFCRASVSDANLIAWRFTETPYKDDQRTRGGELARFLSRVPALAVSISAPA